MTRRTLRRGVWVEGRGLFTDAPADVMIFPAGEGGLVLESAGQRFPPSTEHIDDRPAHPAFAAMPPRCTTLAPSASSAPVHTVEHLLAALAGLGVTDALVRIEGGEAPIGDGSAAIFTTPTLEAGLVEVPGQAEPIAPREPIVVRQGDASITIEPADEPLIEYHLDYGPASPIPPGVARWDGTPESFTAEVAPARTFCLQHEAEALHAMGLFRGLTPRDMLVFGPAGPIDNALRFPDEPARHKLLDLIGDLALAARPIRARVIAVRSGHALNREAARRLSVLS